jgi:hypothetical protein
MKTQEHLEKFLFYDKEKAATGIEIPPLRSLPCNFSFFPQKS